MAYPSGFFYFPVLLVRSVIWAVNTGAYQKSTLIWLSVMVTIGALFWGVRFSVAHILAAVGYPLRDFLTRVDGLGISLRLVALEVLCVLPAAVLNLIVLAPFLPGGEVSPARDAVAMVLGSPAIFASTAILNAAAVLALKEILGRKA